MGQHLALHGEVALAFKVCDVKEDGLVGSEDTALLRLALTENRVVLTHDSDFGTLAIAQEEPFIGIVYLRPGHVKPEFTLKTIETLLDQNPDLETPFIVVAVRTGETVRLRIRQTEKG